jgi:type II secretory pathway pseudopilin PulG
MEMLIAITIMVMLMALAATTIVPATESRRAREAARALNVYLGAARNRAMETGRPCGVILHQFGGLACSMSIDQCEVPPCYCGETETAAVTLQLTTLTTISVNFFDGGQPSGLLTGFARPGDLIQFNCQGPYYSILGSPNTVDGNGFVTTVASSPISVTVADVSQNSLVPWPTPSATSLPVPYRIFRAPMKGAGSALQLPAAAVVDFTASGVDGGALFNAGGDVTILFSPNGGVDRLYANGTFGPVSQTIFLLVGKRERVSNTFVAAPAPANQSSWPNYQDLDNIWVTVNPQTGLVVTDQVAASTTAMDPASAINAARTLARDAQGMGGK